MPLKANDATCQMASVFKCPRGTCWATVAPMRLLCRECFRMTFGSDPE